MDELTPMLRQYLEIKDRHKDAILFFRMGDFYEMFFQDAEIASKALDITLTSRNKHNDEAIPMAGVPHHAAPGYINRLIEQGFKVAICDQVEDARLAKGIVRREVTQVVTPGVVLEPDTLEAKANNYLLGLVRRRSTWGIAYLDISTGDFYTAEPANLAELGNELGRIEPKELVVPQSLELDPEVVVLVKQAGCLANYLDDSLFELRGARELLLDHFQVRTLDGFGCQDYTAGLCAAGAVLHYLNQTRPGGVLRLDRLVPYRLHDYLVLDEATKRNLELLRTLHDGKKAGSLLHLIDATVTSMGGRLLRRWMVYPLIDPVAIHQRLDEVTSFVDERTLREGVREHLQRVSDLERLNGRVVARTAHARDLLAMGTSLQQLPLLAQQLEAGGAALARFVALDLCQEVVDLIGRAIAEDPPTSLRDGGMIRPGYSPELDELALLSREGKGYIARLEAQERARTGINSLKVRYNKVFGYFIEVTRSNLEGVPDHYIRKQTLTNAERFITPELKEYETKVLGAEERRVELEYQLFADVREQLAQYQHRVKQVAQLLAELDAISALAHTAVKHRYARPIVDGGDLIEIRDGRHPVVEEHCGRDRFRANDIRLDNREQQVMILTGPNMAGKSTIMRQVALIALLAQMGSYVPARHCQLGVVDRIFTRVGASDNLARGQSTFMVEMTETSNILHFATARSLVVLDEIGRGTSTYDGLAIAWAVAEALHDRVGCKTLFATHYHELVDLALTKTRVRNFNIAVTEWGDQVMFLYKLREGGASRSYGIQVARLAGLPRDVIERAREILGNLERGEFNELGEPRLARRKGGKERHSGQLTLFGPPSSPLREAMLKLDTNAMTPLEALTRLVELQDLARSEG